MRCYQLVQFGDALTERSGYAPVPTGSEILVRVKAAGVCHSDVHISGGSYDMGGGNRASLASRISLPLTLGHEMAGEAVAAGPDASPIELGSNYLVCPWIGCRHCEACVAGDEHLCATPRFLGVNTDGGFADYVLVPHPRYLISLGSLDPVDAAPYACSGVTTYSALKKLLPGLKERPVVFFGAGGLGLMALTMLRLLGGAGAIVVDIDASKRDAALAAGALAAIDGRAVDAAQQVRAAAGRPILGVADFVGSGDTVGLGFDLLAKGGKLVVVGLYGGAVSLSCMLIPSKAATIQGSYVGSVDEMREMMALVAAAAPPSIPISRRPLSEAEAALSDLRAGQIIGRTVLVPWLGAAAAHSGQDVAMESS